MKKKLMALLLAISCLTVSVPVCAADDGGWTDKDTIESTGKDEGVTTTGSITQESVGTDGTTRQCEVTYTKAGSYQVVIPKVIVLQKKVDNQYTVKVKGDIASTDSVYVVPTKNVKMHDSKGKADISCDVNLQTPSNSKDGVVEFAWDTINAEDGSNTLVGSTHTDQIDGSSLTAGDWSGELIFEIQCAAKGDNDTKEAARVDGVCKQHSTP